MGRDSSKETRSVFWTVLLVGLVWLCLGGRSMSSGSETSMELKRNNNERKELLLHSHSHLHSVSKRRVPNGPDPIHNRRTVKSRQPSTRA